jgi:hypothetical protein
MVFGRRRIDGIGYIRYMDLLQKLMMANATLYREFIMVSTKTSEPLFSDYLVGVPSKLFLALFDGSNTVEDVELPEQIDVLHFADTTTDEFKSRFQSADRGSNDRLVADV